MHFLIYSKIIPPVGVQIKTRRAAQKSGGSLPLKDAFTFKKNQSACWQLTFVVGAPCLNCIKKILLANAAHGSDMFSTAKTSN
jgi:hypothetical protein